MLDFAAPKPNDGKLLMPELRGERARVVHQNLDTAYVNLAALVRHLQQRDFAGRVHVELDEYDADIFLSVRGRPRVRERDHVTGRASDGEAALQRVIVRASEPGGRVSVYEGDFEPAEPGAHRAAWSRLADSVGTTAATGESETRAQEEIDRRNVLQLGGELIAAVERAIVAVKGGEFAALFREARAEVADEYPFLSSLADCVEYVGDEARLARRTDATEFVAGVCEALRRVVERAANAEGAGARGVRREVARELSALSERRPRALARFGFNQQLERIAGLRWT
jgi:hypothetical protein